jgi:hypothetical protein
MGGPAVVGVNWKSFIDEMLACGAASVTAHVRVDGAETTKISGKPVTVRLSARYCKVIHAKWVTVRWALYVNPTTYLPVPTTANIAKTMVTIPPGFRKVGLDDV